MANPKRPPIPQGAEPLTHTALDCEIIRARLKFPGNDHLMVALMEEVGELAQAYLQGKPRDEIEREALQVACVAMRIVEEGDRDFAPGSPLATRKPLPCERCGLATKWLVLAPGHVAQCAVGEGCGAGFDTP